MKTLLSFLLMTRIVLASELTSFAPADVKAFIENNPQVTTVDDFLRRLPQEFFSNYVMLIGSESIQPASPTHPRVLLSRADASAVVAFSTMRDEANEYVDNSVEMLSFNATEKRFDFHRLRFDGEKASYEPNPAVCQTCHGKSPRPNWDSYQIWPNALPFNADRLFQDSEEEKLFKHLYFSLKDDSRFSVVKPFKGITVTEVGTDIEYDWTEDVVEFKSPQGITVSQGGKALQLDHPKANAANGDGQATALFDNFTKWNAIKVAAEVKAHPSLETFKFAVQGILMGCLNDTAAYAKFFPEATIKAHEEKLGHTIESLLANTIERKKSINHTKLGMLSESFRKVVESNAQRNGESLTEEEIRERMYRDIYRRNPKSKNSFPVDPETGLNSAETRPDGQVAAFRFVLEPEGVAMDKWSLNSKERSETYAFADQIGIYIGQLHNVTRPLIDNDTAKNCDTLGVASLKAYQKR